MTERLAFVLTHELLGAPGRCSRSGSASSPCLLSAVSHARRPKSNGFVVVRAELLSGSTGDRPCGGSAEASLVRQPVVCGHDRL